MTHFPERRTTTTIKISFSIHAFISNELFFYSLTAFAFNSVSLSRRGELHEDAGRDVVRGNNTNTDRVGTEVGWGGASKLCQGERERELLGLPWSLGSALSRLTVDTHTRHCSGPVFQLAVKRGGASDGFSSVTNQPGSRHHQFSTRSHSLRLLFILFYPSPSISLSLYLFHLIRRYTLWPVYIIPPVGEFPSAHSSFINWLAVRSFNQLKESLGDRQKALSRLYIASTEKGKKSKGFDIDISSDVCVLALTLGWYSSSVLGSDLDSSGHLL